MAEGGDIGEEIIWKGSAWGIVKTEKFDYDVGEMDSGGYTF